MHVNFFFIQRKIIIVQCLRENSSCSGANDMGAGVFANKANNTIFTKILYEKKNSYTAVLVFLRSYMPLKFLTARKMGKAPHILPSSLVSDSSHLLFFFFFSFSVAKVQRAF